MQIVNGFDSINEVSIVRRQLGTSVERWDGSSSNLGTVEWPCWVLTYRPVIHSGGCGLAILEQALSAGQKVTALVRDPAKLGNIQTHANFNNLTIVKGNALDADAVARTVAGK